MTNKLHLADYNLVKIALKCAPLFALLIFKHSYFDA